MPYHYQQLRRHLRSPRQIIIDPLQRECDPPEDSDWPTPTTFREVNKLMSRLPHWAQVVCAHTAAEMVLSIWVENDWVNENLTREEIEAPRRAIEITWQWLDGEASEGEVNAVAETARTAAWAAWAGNDATWPARDAAWAAIWGARAAAEAAWAAARTTRAAEAAWAAARAAWGDVEEFYREWWDLCRCRLAFIDPQRT